MKRWLALLAISVLFLLLLTACNTTDDDLSGKSFKVAYTPVIQEDIDKPNKYQSAMTLAFKDGEVVSSVNDGVTGSYELNDDELVLDFENENERLEVKFINFQESTKDFSSYSTIIGEMNHEVEDTSQVKRFNLLTNKLQMNMPIEFIVE